MTTPRLLLVAGVVAALVGLSLWGDGTPVASGDDLRRPAVPVAGDPDAASSTWYCAAGAGAGEGPWRHEVVLVDPSGADATATVTAVGPEGTAGSTTVEVAVPGPTVVAVQEAFEVGDLSVLVESASPELVVEHRVVGDAGADQVPCLAASSRDWYFPAMSTTRGNSALLVLFNPFPVDASVDITAAIEDGVRAPQQWQGLVVPSGTRRVVDLGAAGGIERRDLFSVVVEARNGRVVAETAQTLGTEADEDEGTPATRGLRLQPGVPRAATTWSVAGGFTGAGVDERLVVFNPGDDPVTALAQVTPYGGAELPPEPFELEIPARRFQVVDLSSESRVPGEGFHSLTVDAERPVVVARVTTIVGAPAAEASEETPARPGLERGTAVAPGTPLASQVWIATGVLVGDRQSGLFVHNPGPGIAVVAAVVLGGEADGAVLVEETEVAAGDGVVVPTQFADLGDGVVSVLVEASSPVTVDALVTFEGQDDLAFSGAVPLRTGSDGLVPLGGGGG